MGDPFTFHVSHKDVSVCPLVDPMLEGAAFEYDLRGASCHQAAISLSDTVLLTGPAQVLLHRGIRDVVGRSVNQVQRNYPAWEHRAGSAPAGELSQRSKWRFTARLLPSPSTPLSEGGRRARCPSGHPHHPQEPSRHPRDALPGCEASRAAAPHLLGHRSKIRDSSCLGGKDLAVLAAGVLDFTFLERQTEESGNCPAPHHHAETPRLARHPLGPRPFASLSRWSKDKPQESSELLRVAQREEPKPRITRTPACWDITPEHSRSGKKRRNLAQSCRPQQRKGRSGGDRQRVPHKVPTWMVIS